MLEVCLRCCDESTASFSACNRRASDSIGNAIADEEGSPPRSKSPVSVRVVGGVRRWRDSTRARMVRVVRTWKREESRGRRLSPAQMEA